MLETNATRLRHVVRSVWANTCMRAAGTNLDRGRVRRGKPVVSLIRAGGLSDDGPLT